MDTISIIVPIYNAENTLERCINSILNQTYHQLEIILIDDGSLDNSGKICDIYATKDNRITVIHQQNGGVSKARQSGLDNAHGRFIIHADPDDWIDPTMCQELIDKAIKEEADFVLCDFWMEEENKSYYKDEQPTNISAQTILCEMIIGMIHGSCCNKLVKKSIIDSNGISFTPANITYLEDLLFNCKLLNQKNIKVAYLHKAFYHYTMTNNSSLSQTIGYQKIQSELIVLSEIEKMSDANNCSNYYSLKKNIVFHSILSNRNDLTDLFCSEIKSSFLKDYQSFNIYTPISNCIFIAINGYTHFARIYYFSHMRLFHFYRYIKKGIKRLFKMTNY